MRGFFPWYCAPSDTPAALLPAAFLIDTTLLGRMVGRGRACAALVYKDCDFRAVEQFIRLEQQYGREKVEKAAAIIKEKIPASYRRPVYFFRLFFNAYREIRNVHDALTDNDP